MAKSPGKLLPRAAAIVVWCFGVATTYSFLTTTLGDSEYTLLAAAALQFALTVAQSPIWHGRGGAVSWLALAFDVFVNVGGTAPIAANLDQSAAFLALLQLPDYTGLPFWIEFLTATGIGLLLAAAPEALWRGK